MKKDSHILKDLDLMSDPNIEIITEALIPIYSLPEFAKDEDYISLMEDEENIECLLKNTTEDDVIDLFGNKIIDDF